MPDIPDISSMSPDRWLSKMQTVRAELLEEFEGIFDGTDGPDEAVERFDALFDDYTVQTETGDSEPLLQVEARDDRLIFTHHSGDERVALECDDGTWLRADDFETDADPGTDAHRRELGIAALQLIPWWAEGAFTRRVGNPRDFLD